MCKNWCSDIKERRRATQFTRDERNYMLSCLSCYQVDTDGWRAMMKDYMSGQGL